MATNAGFASTPHVEAGEITTGDTGKGPGAPTNKVPIFTAGASGSRIERIKLQARGATVQSTVRLFLFDGSNYRLWMEILLPASTPVAGTNNGWSFTLEAVTMPNEMPLLLKNGWSIVMTVNDTQTGSAIVGIATGGDF